jgi:apolipoprotein N-acyltransferase
VSAFVTPDGRVHQATAFDKPAVVVDALRLGSDRTLATRLGAGPEYALCVLAVAAVLLAIAIRTRARRAGARAGGNATSEAVG